MATIGKRIKYFRGKLGLSQLELSQKSNVSQASIARIEMEKQKNLKRETIEKLASGLGISLSQLMEEPSIIREERAVYTSVKMTPVIRIEKPEDFKRPLSLAGKSEIFEPSFSADKNAFYLLITDDLSTGLFISKGDMVLVEPAVKVREGDMVLFISTEEILIGKIYYRPDICIIEPLSHDLPPVSFNEKDKRRHKIKNYRISEIKKRYSPHE